MIKKKDAIPLQIQLDLALHIPLQRQLLAQNEGFHRTESITTISTD